MAERGALVRSRIGDFAAITLCGLRSVLGTRCIVVRNVAREAMTEPPPRFRERARLRYGRALRRTPRRRPHILRGWCKLPRRRYGLPCR